MGEAEGLHEVLDPTGKYTFIGEQPFEVTNWDPAVTQQVLTAAIAKYPEIDVIVSDFGPSLVGALPEFEKQRPLDPAALPPPTATSWVLLGGERGRTTPTSSSSRSDRKRPCPPGDPVGRRSRHRRRDAGLEEHQHPVFENSVTGDPNPVQCEPDLPATSTSRRRCRRGPGRTDGLTGSARDGQQRRHPRRGGDPPPVRTRVREHRHGETT